VDFGCGEGTFARDLAADGLEVAGVDIAPAMIETPRQDVPAGVSFDVGSV
jgi:2-polyprenyl-3-methyl-5-hydroxy-6-metoxy-1,4-benzoquinol methylase